MNSSRVFELKTNSSVEKYNTNKRFRMANNIGVAKFTDKETSQRNQDHVLLANIQLTALE
jgi:hypothetical protein